MLASSSPSLQSAALRLGGGPRRWLGGGGIVVVELEVGDDIRGRGGEGVKRDESRVQTGKQRPTEEARKTPEKNQGRRERT